MEVKGRLVSREGGNWLCRFPQILMRMTLSQVAWIWSLGVPGLVNSRIPRLGREVEMRMHIIKQMAVE